ncbi:MAG: beta-N-acetylhexosaminidase [Deltaproteobacteria bacterium]|nr:beta-N-acetylhexosaminidase [Deltaproteobacteria bacterium]
MLTVLSPKEWVGGSVMLDVGNLIMVGLEGLSLLHEEERFLATARPGGVIFFSRNMENRRQIQKLIRSLKRVTGRKDLWVAIDQEGGRVNRWRTGFGNLLSAEELGQELKRTKKGEVILNHAKKIGRDLSALGFNLNFAPVLDVLTTSVNTVIGDRSFGKDPEIVSKAAILFIKGLESQGVMACGKHFPGHGGTVAGPQGDSHKELPTLSHDLKRLKKVEFVPFARAIRAGIHGLMTAHLLLPKIDPQLPASLSLPFVTKILREQMKFKGIIFSDDLLMKGITNHYSLGQAALLALQAGTDHLL